MPASWRDVLGAFAALELRPGCSATAIDAAATDLQIGLPTPLVDFLRETNGVYDRAGHHEYGWSSARIVSENLEAWADREMPLPRDYLAFGDDGTGDCFCMPARAGTEVFHWVWIDSEARQIASDLRSFWIEWFSGELTV
jgi:hypothetical protein